MNTAESTAFSQLSARQVYERARQCRLFISDLDGTLLDKYGRIDRDTLTAVEQLQRQGVQLVLATGRMDRSARVFWQQLNLHTPIISCNGAMIRMPGSEDIFYSQPLPSPALKMLAEYLDKEQIDALIYDAEQVFYRRGSQRIRFFERYNILARSCGMPEVPVSAYGQMTDLVTGHAEPFYKLFTAYLKPRQERYLRTLGTAEQGLAVQASAQQSLDIMAAGQSKGAALVRVAKLLRVAPAETAAAGDQENDIAMFEQAGLSICMKNGTRAARLAADIVWEDHSAAGISRGLQQYFIKH
ncbi:MAG: HAD family hydrolase [Oscillospiraceae bacterium]|nr:HAD family hydrolase [Oscillospiraceae bacterium]MDD4367989.1 HAD family hydrolase [Oscillospiraceae bacterium]